MLQVEIKVDKKKLEADGKYSWEDFDEAVKYAYLQHDCLACQKSSETEYLFYGKGTNNDFSCLWLANLYLTEEEWFMKYALHFVWNDTDVNEPEDLILAVKEEKAGIYA